MESQTDIAIRKLTSEDLSLFESAVELLATVLDENPSIVRGSVDRLSVLKMPTFSTFVALDHETVIGAITAFELPDYKYGGSMLYIYDLAIAPERQQQGLGRRLMDAVFDDARRREIAVVFVQADCEDVGAVKFYRKIGGTPMDVIQFDFSIE